ncbi:alanine racemase [Aquibacillus sp. 3ASR75-11]|uniref:Alanine racemase n=1 Tax=Terrihalobacillus insolitus TaxID=2950438 RepID=A0A9X3WWW2_9BACI|nr:alanine racemase [Terrihalobacillus insolitus]MDC3415228.1 alanine racemase [Terrihalobacillus insolitus]MDC3426268.1 alanine racemase [Terrihalobacillus insolitus]
MNNEPFYRDSWAEIHLDRIDYNIRQLQKHLSNNKGIYAVVKANGYGHGDIEIAKKALEAGATRLAVAILDEALRLRKAGIDAPILVMGWVRPQDIVHAVKHDITLTFFQQEWLQDVKRLPFSGRLKLHMKWDTGMGRVGLREHHEILSVLSELKDDRLELEGIFTHFATADESDSSYFKYQQERFKALYQIFQENWHKDVIIHTGNSAASMRYPHDMEHFVRFGIGMYGLYPSLIVKEERPIDLQPAFSLRSRLIHVKQLQAGQFISYGATYKTKDSEWIGTIPLGYADGLARKLQGMDVLIGGKRMPIVGRICMDQCMVKLDQFYPIGTDVTLIGKQCNDEITADEVARYLETINYEIPCMISYRVPRVYTDKGKIVKTTNPV